MHGFKNGKFILACLAICVLGLALVTPPRVAHGQATPSDRMAVIAKRGTLRCGYIDYPPYFTTELKTGRPRGLTVDLMARLGRDMNLGIVWAQETNWGTMIADLQAGKFDAVCSGVWQNAARARQADFSIPFGYVTVSAWQRDGGRFAGLAALDDPAARLAAIDGEMGETLAAELAPRAALVRLPQNAAVSELLLNVATGKADAAFAEDMVTRDFLKANPGRLRKIPGPAAAAYPVTILLPAGEPRLKTLIDSALAEFLYTGAYDRMLAANHITGADLHKPLLPFQTTSTEALP